MILGRVVGQVWATRKHRLLEGYKLLVVRPFWWYEPSHRVGHLVAIDTDVDAGVGDDVVVCLGEPSRWKSEGVAMPVDAAIMAVVDRCELDDEALAGPRPLTLAEGPRDLIVARARRSPLADEGERS